MCAIIDTCVFPLVFNSDPKKSKRFQPLYKWIRSKEGKLIIGGSEYERQIKGCLGILVEYEKLNKLVKLSRAKVDALEGRLKRKEPSSDFDDAHLIAMSIVSRCCVICTDEKRAVKYIQNKGFYPKGMRPPKIYRNGSHAHLCCKDNVAEVCRDDKNKK